MITSLCIPVSSFSRQLFYFFWVMKPLIFEIRTEFLGVTTRYNTCCFSSYCVLITKFWTISHNSVQNVYGMLLAFSVAINYNNYVSSLLVWAISLDWAKLCLSQGIALSTYVITVSSGNKTMREKIVLSWDYPAQWVLNHDCPFNKSQTLNFPCKAFLNNIEKLPLCCFRWSDLLLALYIIYFFLFIAVKELPIVESTWSLYTNAETEN